MSGRWPERPRQPGERQDAEQALARRPRQLSGEAEPARRGRRGSAPPIVGADTTIATGMTHHQPRRPPIATSTTATSVRARTNPDPGASRGKSYQSTHADGHNPNDTSANPIVTAAWTSRCRHSRRETFQTAPSAPGVIFVSQPRPPSRTARDSQHRRHGQQAGDLAQHQLRGHQKQERQHPLQAQRPQEPDECSQINHDQERSEPVERQPRQWPDQLGERRSVEVGVLRARRCAVQRCGVASEPVGVRVFATARAGTYSTIVLAARATPPTHNQTKPPRRTASRGVISELTVPILA
jgi:hypothetical protein